MGTIDEAWHKAEAALDRGYVIKELRRNLVGGWEVWAGIPDDAPPDADFGYGPGKRDGGWGPDYGEGTTPEEALRDLARRCT
jgi:hypothetical protein